MLQETTNTVIYIYIYICEAFFFNEYMWELFGIQNLESIALHIYIYNINNSKLYELFHEPTNEP